MNYLDLTIGEIHAALMAHKTTPLELCEEAICRVQNDTCNAFEATNFDEARRVARDLVFDPEELLSGIPFVAKDNFSTEGLETTASSDMLNGYVPLFDAEAVARLKKRGAVLIAKTTLDELAMGGTGTTGHKGVTLNPYDRSRIIGGSSCGSCAAVADGIVPFALGSDTGDSVRKPASLGGLVGFKPTWGRISRFGLLPFAASMDTVGFFTRSVADAAILTEVLSGRDPKDMSCSYQEVDSYRDWLHKEATNRRIGFLGQLLDEIEDKTVVGKFREILDKLNKQGYQLIDYKFPQNLLNALFPTYMVLSCCEATSNNACLDGIRYGPGTDTVCDDYRDYIVKSRTAGFGDSIKQRFVIGSFSLHSENRAELFDRAQRCRRLIVDELARLFDKCDYLLLPAASGPAKHVEDVQTRWSDKPDYIDNILGLANLGGLPSLTLPIGLENGLPFGINVTCRPFCEGEVINLSQKIEDLTGLYNLSTRTLEEK